MIIQHYQINILLYIRFVTFVLTRRALNLTDNKNSRLCSDSSWTKCRQMALMSIQQSFKSKNQVRDNIEEEEIEVN